MKGTYRKLALVLLPVLLIALLGVVGCDQPKQDTKDQAKKAEPAKLAKKAKDEERFKVPLPPNAACKGADNALVTILEFSEFQCPFCNRVNPTIKKLMDENKGNVRVCFMHNPLPFHKNAMPASRLALLARDKGKFWEMHDKLFANQKQLDKENLLKFAEELGLDKAEAEKAVDGDQYDKEIKEIQNIARTFQARGTPHFFINGIRLAGAQPYDKFKAVVDAELKNAEQFKGEKDIYAAVTKDGKTKAEPPKRKGGNDEKDTAVYKFDLASGADSIWWKGAKDNALITVVEMSEFQCPFCNRVNPTVKKIMDEYKGKVRVGFWHNPLPFHKNAEGASLAALEAGRQGKFWEYHDLLFKNQKALGTDDLVKYAKELGLDGNKIKAAIDNKTGLDTIKKMQAEGTKFGARGTPAFFINGRKITGARPFEQFKELIDEVLKTAESVSKANGGILGDKLYAKLTEKGKEKAEAPKRNNRPKEDPNKVYDVPVDGSICKGPANAKVTIMEFSEFQCPFCSRVLPTLKKIDEEYKGKVRVCFKHSPLPFHKDAPLASEAALAAGDQGKFWEMHDKLFGNQKALKRADLEKYAQELGLDMSKFKAALDSGAMKEQIKKDQDLGRKVGARGTPTFFINGKKLVGAQPFENFKKMIDEALK